MTPMKSAQYVIGIDLGGTNVRAAAVLPTGKVRARVKKPSGASGGYGEVVRNIRSAMAEVEGKMKRPPSAAGLASAGAVDPARKIVARSPNFPGWRNAPLARDASAGFAFPVYLENDANAAALGEGWLGAAKGWPEFAMMTLGTGVGGGIVLGGSLWRGATGKAGEVGHINVRPGGRKCGCGARGCLETTASATGVVRTALERMDGEDGAGLRKAVRGDRSRVTAKMVTKLAGEGDDLCRRILEEAGADLGAAMAVICLITGVTRFVIGGGMAPALALMAPPARKAALGMAYTLTGPGLKIVPAALGDDAGVIGAARAAMNGGA